MAPQLKKVVTKTIETKAIEAKAPKGRPPHPAVGRDGVWPFEALPGDFDLVKHKPLRKKDFSTEAAYYDYRVMVAESRVEKLRERATLARTLGGAKDAAKARRLLRIRAKFAELRRELEGAGIDVDALLAAQGA